LSHRIVVVGSSNTDMILQTQRIPRPGETILAGTFSMAAGGKGANQAVAAARAGGRVTFVARVGDDMFGERAVEGFRHDGIDVTHVVRDPDAASGVALIFVAADGENSIGVASGANGRLSPGDVQRAEGVIRSADVLLMQLETPLETVRAAAEIASSAGVRVILNPAPAQPLGEDVLRHVSILTPNESESELLTGIKVEGEPGAARAADALLERGFEAVIVTLGADGAFVATRDRREHVPGFQVQAVDTTAAGDVFNGTLSVSLAEGKDLTQAVRFANAAAALAVMKLGAQPSAPTREAIEAFIAERA
jgi:ribokinase